jgi:precorrin-3B synthase
MTGADAVVKGWCPGVLRPMQSGDGLIVRLRLHFGIVDLALAQQIAFWSRSWGNGQIDLSNRANLHLRGFSERHLPDLRAALEAWDLLDRDVAAEAVRNVICSPLTGLDPDAELDVRPIVRGIELRLTNDATLRSLPGKFGFAIDDGGMLGLDGVPADVQFAARRTANGPVFGVRLAGAAQNSFGACPPDAVADVAEALARVFLRLRAGHGENIRRMRDLVVAHGADTIAREAGLDRSGPSRPTRTVPPSVILGAHALGSAGFLGAGLPFGRITADDLSVVASAAAANGARELRLTPWRTILVPVPSIVSARALASGLAQDAFILHPDDPRLRIAACPGAPACVRGTTPVRADAGRLAAEIAGAAGSGITIHLSGCAKACAHPHAAPVTLVARNGRYDLVRDGVASALPALRDLSLEQAAEHARSIIADQPRAGAA